MADLDKNKSRNKMVNLINKGMAGIYETNDALGRVWRILCYRTGLRAHQWDAQLSKWERKTITTLSAKDSSSIKGNITQALSKEKLTWSNLLTGFAILGYTRVDIKFTLHGYNKTEEIEVTISDLSSEDISDDEA